jgi:AcrR family transcriptional regulator
MGTSKRTIYTYFSDKAALLQAGADTSLDAADRQARTILEGGKSPKERFRRLMEWLTQSAAAIDSAALTDIRRAAPSVWRRIEERREGMVRQHLSIAVGPVAGSGTFGERDVEQVVDVIAAAVGGVLTRGEAGGMERNAIRTAEDISVLLRILTAALYGSVKDQ